MKSLLPSILDMAGNSASFYGNQSCHKNVPINLDNQGLVLDAPGKMAILMQSFIVNGITNMDQHTFHHL